jgi:prepilin-type N-terminal cleavage/methylation domain-containing protein/prepilin-type processing-associated H-X9-DG protein
MRVRPRSPAHRCDGVITPGWRVRAFTLIELLVVVAIVSVLMALVFPAIRGTISAARGFRCQSSQRTVAFDFSVFADDQLHGDRGNDSTLGNSSFFRAETFQNSQYGINEFWNYGPVASTTIPDTQGRDPMRCAEVKGNLLLRRNLSCTNGGVTPSANVSFGLNVRLHFSEQRAAAGRPFGVVLTNRILDGYGIASPSSIPLLMDVDGAVAASRSISPLFCGPSLDASTLLGLERFWFPAMRHNRGMNVAFIDGHVKATRAPLAEKGWAWGFEAPLPGR